MPPVKKIGSEDPPLAGPPPPVAGADGIFWVGVATAGANVLTTGGGVEGTRVGAGGRGVAVAPGVVAEAVAVADGAVGAVGPAVGNVRGVVPVGVVVVVAVAVVVVVAVVLGAGVPPVWEPTSMPVNENCAQSGRTSADSRNTATTDVPRPWTTKQPLAFAPLVVSSLLLPPGDADEAGRFAHANVYERGSGSCFSGRVGCSVASCAGRLGIAGARNEPGCANKEGHPTDHRRRKKPPAWDRDGVEQMRILCCGCEGIRGFAAPGLRC